MGQLRGWRRWKMASGKVVCDVRERCEEMTSCLIKIKKQHNPNCKLSTLATTDQLLDVQMLTQVRMYKCHLLTCMRKENPLNLRNIFFFNTHITTNGFNSLYSEISTNTFNLKMFFFLLFGRFFFPGGSQNIRLFFFYVYVTNRFVCSVEQQHMCGCRHFSIL